MKLYIAILLSSLILFWGCKENGSNTENNIAYFGGEIINPNTKFVVLEKGGYKADTIKLDGRNRFLFKIDSLKEGLYSFKHGGEYQLILIEHNDSLLLRLNTLEFDESLVYTGKGAKKNNYFINEFLETEKEEKYILKLCQLDPENYQRRIDSLREIKLKKLDHFIKKHNSSDLFNKIALANINYTYYSSKEVYPFIHYGKNKGDVLKSLPNDFYSYRKDIDYNDNFFKNYHSYYTFLRHSFNTIALENHCDHTEDKYFRWSSLCYNLDRLHLIDSLVTDTDIKEELLYHFTIKYIAMSNNEKSNSEILEAYINKTNSEKSKTMMTNYANSIKQLVSGATLPSLQVLDYNNKEFEINSLIKSPTVVNFWSHIYHDHFKKSFNKITELREKYPEINFITINIDDVDLEKPKQILKDCRFNCDNQYLFKNPKESKKTLAIYPMTKTFILDKDQKIVSSNSNIFSHNFEEQLLGLINK
ncbi:TlpA family protein disulfide reductase [Seonamhaeicola aphaedonensis]|uniref:Thioredoxin domain-containing protein n=1 Tax=Seonamhaeicola aphaedonensis TaxID=1461338 RepID=A0A3D9HK33_9FLAO|nr:hypothetical protein [Seonamhaeicola aphaedonensis]RED49276.1 hypothetical protein DFQ02_10238 [Seonamhaeicola aphaedonensis]